MNLKEWARVHGIPYQTALRWYHRGLMPVPAHRAGRIVLVDCNEHGLPFEKSTSAPTKTIVYARVFSADQKPDLDRQIAVCKIVRKEIGETSRTEGRGNCRHHW